jgi:hypothetical protein
MFGRPSLGSWLTYGLGSECDNLPGFVVLQSGPRGPRGGAILWGSGVLPTTYQGVPLRNQGEPILNLTNPEGVDQQAAGAGTRCRPQTELLSVLQKPVTKKFRRGMNAYEMAYRMQTSAPELMDTSWRKS